MSLSECTGPNGNIARLFPLDGVVLFPHALLPLHIFEPRYRDLTRDALESDRGVTLVLPADCSARPPILHRTGCFGAIMNEQRTCDGRYYYVLKGLSRVRLDEELCVETRYRQAKVTILRDYRSPENQGKRKLERVEIVSALRRLIPDAKDETDQFFRYLAENCESGMFSDIVAYAAPLPIPVKQQLLEELDVDKRLELLVEELRTIIKDRPAPCASRKFPPDFSGN